MRDERLLLGDILEAIDRVERYASRGREAFDRDELIQVWIIHHLQILGEAASNLPDERRARHPEIRWPEIVAMRHILVHEYFGVDLETVWATAEHNLPVLKQQVRGVLAQLG